MATPPVDDETLLATHAAFVEHESNQTATAKALGVSRETVQRRLRNAAERGLLPLDPVMPGFAIKSVANRASDGSWVRQVKEHGEEYKTPDGHSVKGESALVDAEGRVIQKWVKTRNEYSPQDWVEIFRAAFDGYESPHTAPAPAAYSHDLLTLYPCNDWHINLLTWGRETGQNWDLKIAERVIGEGIDETVARSPASGTAIVLGGGDLVHADTNDNRTAQSGNVLEADGRHQKGIEVAQRLKVRAIDRVLAKNDRVIVRILKGNHDEYSSTAIAYFLRAWYRNDPRVSVDVDPSLFFWHRFGKVMLGATHGHTVKLKDMAAIMAHRRPQDWGASRFRYVHGFHIHHQSKYATEGGGVISESHQAPVPQDAWHFGSGYLSGRSLQSITYHKLFGEVSRVRVAMLDAGDENVIDKGEA